MGILARRSARVRTISAMPAVCAIACLGLSVLPATVEAMTISQMSSLGGAAQLDVTADRLFDRCGLPAAIVDQAGSGDVRRNVSWRGTTMRLSETDWEIAYGSLARDTSKNVAWANPATARKSCLFGVAWLVFQAKGRVGVLSVMKKSDGSGYATTYHVPDNLLQAHKVVGVKAALSRRIPVAALVDRYGRPDEVLRTAGGRERHRYWVLTHNDRRPESLHAVDFYVDTTDRSSREYEITTTGADFVSEKMGSFLREWESDYVRD